MPGKFLIETFGCQMNVLDSEKIAGNLSAHGYKAAKNIQDADLVILNTCSVRDKAVQKVYARLGEINRQKAGRKNLIVGVAGCMAQLEGEKILKKAPCVDILAGPQKSYSMHAIVEEYVRTGDRGVNMRSDDEPVSLEIPYILRENPWRASVTISEGCNRRCTYCVVPVTRGNERVRSCKRIIKEVLELAAQGYIEIMLLGQTVNSYIDREEGNVTFAELLTRIAAIPGIRRIRFTSPYPTDFTDELLDVMTTTPQVCNHIHLPVQSGSTRILKAMGRGYTREGYLDIIRKIRLSSRHICISTDLIVGFPGEDEKDFEETLSLMDAVEFDNAFSFKYSPRPKTEAFQLSDSITEADKSRKLYRLQDHQREIQYRNNSGYLGKILEVFVDSKARSRVNLTGRTSGNKIVNFDGPDSLIGRFAQVKIIDFSPNSLKGTWLQKEGLK